MKPSEKSPTALRCTAHSGAPDPGSDHMEASARALTHLKSEFMLVERALRIERERVAELADSWGHGAFASFLRERLSRDGNAER
jgi:hypothetical protein